MYSKHLFDKITFNNREEEGAVGVHILKAGLTCRYFKMPLEEMDAPDFWDKVMERAHMEWASVDVLADPCPTCGLPQRMWKRRYEGHSFCGFCSFSLDIPKEENSVNS